MPLVTDWRTSSCHRGENFGADRCVTAPLSHDVDSVFCVEATTALSEVFVRRREKREETRRRMKERRKLIRRGLDELGRGMLLLRHAEERGITSSEAAERLRSLADEVELIALQLDTAFPTQNVDLLPSLLRKGQEIAREAARHVDSMKELNEAQLAEPLGQLKGLIEEYTNAARPSLAPSPVPPLLRLDWRRLVPNRS